MAKKGRKKGESYIRILGMFDKKTRLISDAHAFVIQIFYKPKEAEGFWKSSYYYSTLQDSIRGYCKYIAKKKRTRTVSSKPLLDLLDHVTKLDTTINTACERLSADFAKIKEE